MVHEYMDGSMSIFHGPRQLASYTQQGELKDKLTKGGSAAA